MSTVSMDSCSYISASPRTPKKACLAGHDGDLIEIVNILQNKLAACGHSLDISLPQIVVVGCQSAGKSSVLENIVGKEFLPRGSGVVTRRPTVVQLHKSEDEYAEFLHKPGVKFTDFEDVRDEIRDETLRDPGPVGFSSVPISLKIFSPKVLKLSLVDLPGLIRVTVDKQSENSIKEVRNMVMEYISQPNSLILAVTPANQDIANSDALEIAKIVDPGRVRTIGVLTKLDLMDEGTDARDILENKKLPLKRGYVGVLNRSQKDIDEERDFDYCLQKERQFFESMPCYRHMADRMGTPYLKKFLNRQLYTHIKEYLPSVRQELSQTLAVFQKKLKDLKGQIGCNSTENYNVQSYMIKILQGFVEGLQVEISGYSELVSMDRLSGGSIINYKLHNNGLNDLKLPKIPDENELLVLISNLHGMRNSMSLPSLALEAVVKNLLPQYIDPLNSLVDDIGDTLLSNIEQRSEKMDPYPSLKNEVLYLVQKYVQDAIYHTKDSLEKHMKAEMHFVNTYHQDFAFPESKNYENFFPMKVWDKRDACAPVSSPQEIVDNSCVENRAMEILKENNSVKNNARYLAETIGKYLDIQQKHVKDTAIKYILFFLVKTVMDFIKSELIPSVLESDDIESVLDDCAKDFNKIIDLKTTCEYLEDALNAVRTF